MKRIILAVLFLSIFHLPSFTLHGQNVGINSTGASPNTSSLIDIDASPANNKGLLIPRVSFAQRTGLNFNPLPAAAQGLFIYQTDAGGFGEGFYYNTSVTTTPTWVKLFTSTTGWSLTGNSGTSGGPNFLGTRDNISLRFRTNNTQKMIIDSMGNVGIGTAVPIQKLHIAGNSTGGGNQTGAQIGDIGAGAGPLYLIHNSPQIRGNSYFNTVNFYGGGTGKPSFIDMANGIHFGTSNNAVGAANTAITDFTEKMTLTSDGNLGIGTTNPLSVITAGTLSRSLEVNGWILARSNGNNSWGDVATRIGVISGSSTNQCDAWWMSANPTANTFAIHQACVGDRLTITQTGNVGIGVTSPAEKLEVNGLVIATGSTINISLNQCGGACGSYHALGAWTNVSAIGYAWSTNQNTAPTVFSHNGAGTITVLRAGTYMIKLYSMAIPVADAPWVEQVLPYINGVLESYPSGGVPYVHHGYHPAGWWDQEVSVITRTLSANTTVQWGYYPVGALSYWAHDTYTAMEIIRVN